MEPIDPDGNPGDQYCPASCLVRATAQHDSLVCLPESVVDSNSSVEQVETKIAEGFVSELAKHRPVADGWAKPGREGDATRVGTWVEKREA